MSEIMEFSLTSKGKPLLIMEGYSFRINPVTDGITSWVYLKEKKSRCPGSVKTGNQRLIERSMKPHTCVPNEAEIEMKKKLATCRKRAMDNVAVAVHEIFRQEFRVSAKNNNI
jgi:hypothetical protein